MGLSCTQDVCIIALFDEYKESITAQQSVLLTCGSLRRFQAFSSLRVFPAPDPPLPLPHAGNASRWAFRDSESIDSHRLCKCDLVFLQPGLAMFRISVDNFNRIGEKR